MASLTITFDEEDIVNLLKNEVAKRYGVDPGEVKASVKVGTRWVGIAAGERQEPYFGGVDITIKQSD